MPELKQLCSRSARGGVRGEGGCPRVGRANSDFYGESIAESLRSLRYAALGAPADATVVSETS